MGSYKSLILLILILNNKIGNNEQRALKKGNNSVKLCHKLRLLIKDGSAGLYVSSFWNARDYFFCYLLERRSKNRQEVTRFNLGSIAAGQIGG
jgi:hypothetical protein